MLHIYFIQKLYKQLINSNNSCILNFNLCIKYYYCNNTNILYILFCENTNKVYLKLLQIIYNKCFIFTNNTGNILFLLNKKHIITAIENILYKSKTVVSISLLGQNIYTAIIIYFINNCYNCVFKFKVINIYLIDIIKLKIKNIVKAEYCLQQLYANNNNEINVICFYYLNEYCKYYNNSNNNNYAVINNCNNICNYLLINKYSNNNTICCFSKININDFYIMRIKNGFIKNNYIEYITIYYCKFLFNKIFIIYEYIICNLLLLNDNYTLYKGIIAIIMLLLFYSFIIMFKIYAIYTIIYIYKHIYMYIYNSYKQINNLLTLISKFI